MTFDPHTIRDQFPGLKRQAIFLDNPAGTQIVQRSLDRITDYLINTNANHEGVFATSREFDAVIEQARQASADFLNAPRPEEVTFGPNMTSLTLNLSRSLARTLEPGDTIAVTRLDHDANITPWTLIAADQGCEVSWVDFDVEDGRLRWIPTKKLWTKNQNSWLWGMPQMPWDDQSSQEDDRNGPRCWGIGVCGRSPVCPPRADRRPGSGCGFSGLFVL